MTKVAFMYWCWSRSFKYGETHRIAHQMNITDIPSREEYEGFYKEADDSYYSTLE